MDETRVERFHGVRFYDSTEAMAGIVAAFLGTGFITHEPALVIATRSHRRAIAQALAGCSFSVDLLQQSGNLVLLDASDTLSTLLVHGTPDPVRFESAVSRRFGRLGHAHQGPVRAYDEMGDMLWRGGTREAAIQLESLWDRWTVTHRCSLVCGHAVPNFRDHGAPRVLCEQHSHIIAANGLPHPLCRVAPSAG